MARIYLIAGEASGDALGAKLMHALRECLPDIEFTGIGGTRMRKEGLNSLFPMEELSLIGFAEIIPHIPQLLKRIKETVNHILDNKPDILITIDAPGFNKRVVQQLRKRSNNLPKIVHYVAPSVWAYKPKRAETMAKLFDHLLVLLPFEPPYFKEVGLPCTFVGHPIVEEPIRGGDGHAFRAKYTIPETAPILLILPGSREGELQRLLPVFRMTLAQLQVKFPELHGVVLATPAFQERLEEEIKEWTQPTHVIASPEDKAGALAASTLALAKSGTITLELAMAGIPMVVAYKVNPVSAWMLRRMIRVPYVNLINIIRKETVIPELLQEACTPESLTEALGTLLEDDTKREHQRQIIQETMHALGDGELPSPSEKAAKVVVGLLN
ncbi:MAG: lipid-A-disaccharide synthase [Rickettsiales bacterium]|nr:lipid-A-disaccharide synthase [Rickettsiales bacterium]